MPSSAALLLFVVAFAAMEPITAGIHRWVMHGFGGFLHRSHHRPRTGRFETNDWYPVFFAAIVNLGLFAGFNIDGLGALVPVGVGVTAYGMAYALVHDVYIHGRLGWFTNHHFAPFDRLAEAHRIHHLYTGAPYGMLAPVVPRELRRRARSTPRNPLVSR